MAVSPVEYRHEYVSGVVTVVAFPAALSANVANRGGTQGRARVLVRVGSDLVLDSDDSVDIPNGVVEPGNVWSFESGLPKGIDTKTVSYWVEILTTSPDLIPSLAFQETVSSDGNVKGMRESVYFAPGDFAVFPLHPVLVRPPVIPPIEA
jgi:hypothetical protein